MNRRYYRVHAWLDDDNATVCVLVTTGHVKAGRCAADLVRFGLAREAKVTASNLGRLGQPAITRLGRILGAALAAHRAGLA